MRPETVPAAAPAAPKPVPLDYQQILGPDVSDWIKKTYAAFYQTFYPDRR